MYVNSVVAQSPHIAWCGSLERGVLSLALDRVVLQCENSKHILKYPHLTPVRTSSPDRSKGQQQLYMTNFSGLMIRTCGWIETLPS
ncbi:hypothetical protein TNCV_3779481 [Trichonephila clavipes]|nr:hypothetical protein TNCV_3779481 [Trichonephila clavipes]